MSRDKVLAFVSCLNPIEFLLVTTVLAWFDCYAIVVAAVPEDPPPTVSPGLAFRVALVSTLQRALGWFQPIAN